MSFCHLHVHDEYSLLDGLGTAEQYCAKAKEKGFKYLAITNHGNHDGAIKFQKEAEKVDICPIFGVELYVVEDIAVKTKGEKRKHVVVYIKNETGWANLNKLLTVANLEGFYYRPRISPEVLLDNLEGLVISTACSSSFISEGWGQELLLKLYREIPEDVFLEIMPHRYADQIQMNSLCLELHDKYGIMMVATNDCHYVNAEDNYYHEILLAMQSKKKWTDKDRWRFSVDGLYLKSKEEMEEAFDAQGSVPKKAYIEAMENSLRIAQQCSDFKIEQLNTDLPAIARKPAGVTDEEFLRDLCYSGFEKRIINTHRSGKRSEYRKRMQEELSVIIGQGFSSYFLIVWELIDWCRSNDIMVGPGRGSSAGSLVCFLLGITSLDPIEHDLLFARFISPARIDLPDIDMDFEDIKRSDIWKHMKEVYGEHNVAAVSTFSSMKGRGALRDISRVFDVPLADVNAASSCIVVRSGGDFRSDFTIEDAFATFEDGRRFKTKYPGVTKAAIRMEGQVKGKGQHAAAICVSKESLHEGKRGFLSIGGKGDPVINWDKYDIEHVGLMKLDVLGLNALTILNCAKRLIKTNRGVDIDYEALGLDDERIFQEFTEGHTVGIFQFGSLGLRKVCKEIGIDNFKILTDTNALFRPGTLRSGMVTEYQQRKNGEKEWHHRHPFLASITGGTYGVLLYQEQVMRFMYDLGGLGWKTADTVRKVMSKSQGVEQFLKFKDLFVEGCKKKGTLDEKTAADIWDELSSFGSYGFNKSHAAVYSLIAYWEMFCKVYYPIEFLCASLTYGSDDKKEVLVEEAIRMNIDVRPPKIGVSDAKAWIEKDDVLYSPFIEIKGVGEKLAATMAALSVKKMVKRTAGGFFSIETGANDRISGILQDIGAYKDIPITEEEAINIDRYFDFNLCRDPLRKFKGIIELISESIKFDCVKDIDFGVLVKDNRFYFGQMTQTRFGYRGKIDTLEKKLGASGMVDNLGGVYGNFKDNTDFCMLVFDGNVYARKKDAVEHSSEDFLIAKANHPNRTTSILCNDAWFSEDLLKGNFDGLGLSLIKKTAAKNFDLKSSSGCDKCDLRAECHAPVLPSKGYYNLMVIGEAPGKEEDREGRGFVGKSGDMVWDTLGKHGISRYDVCTNNVCKCWPSLSRTPSKKQIKTCSVYLDREIRAVSPVLILAFGNSCMQFFKNQEKGIMELNGTTEWSEEYGVWICWCIHPASVLYHRENMGLFNEGMENFVNKISVFGGVPII